MRKIELAQGSTDWLTWRKGLLTATDAPMLMGVSPYVTPYKGWQRKLGLVEEQKSNPAMERGQRDEPIARAMFIEKYGINMTPVVIESESYNFLGASLDGISDCGRYILEVKSNGEQYHNYLHTKGIPEFHMMQMQHQLLCTDNTAEKAFYVSYNNGNMICLEVFPDYDWQANYLPKAKDFWKGIVFFEAPPMMQKDYRDMKDSLSWNNYADQYKTVIAGIKALEDKKDYLRKELIKLCDDQNCFGGGVKVLKKLTKGRIDFNEAVQVLNIAEDMLETFRKDSTSSWTILLDQKLAM